MKKDELKKYIKNLNEEELYEILYLLIFKDKADNKRTLDKYFKVDEFIKYLVDEEKILYKNKTPISYADFLGYMKIMFKDFCFFEFFNFCTVNYGVTKAQIINDLFIFLSNLIEENSYFDNFFEFVESSGFSLIDFDDAIKNMNTSSISLSKKSTYDMVKTHNFILILNTNILHKKISFILNDYNELMESIELVECLLEDDDEVTRLAILKIKEKINEILYK